jgi:hypothetical protein
MLKHGAIKPLKVRALAINNNFIRTKKIECNNEKNRFTHFTCHSLDQHF